MAAARAPIVATAGRTTYGQVPLQSQAGIIEFLSLKQVLLAHFLLRAIRQEVMASVLPRGVFLCAVSWI